MIVNEEEALARLNSPDNLVNKLKEQTPPSSNIEYKDLYSNREGPKAIPPMIQTLAVTLGRLDSQQAAASALDMSQANVSYLTNHGKKVDRDQVEKKVDKVHSDALDGMLEAIGLIKPKLQDVKKATDLSAIAANLGKVVRNTTPQEKATTNVKVIVYSPSQNAEADYEDAIIVNG